MWSPRRWLGLLGVLLLGPAVLWLNALVGRQHHEVIAGPVIHKSLSAGSSCVVAIERAEAHDTVQLEVSRATYDALRIGSAFRTEMIRGSLGLLYRVR